MREERKKKKIINRPQHQAAWHAAKALKSGEGKTQFPVPSALMQFREALQSTSPARLQTLPECGSCLTSASGLRPLQLGPKP